MCTMKCLHRENPAAEKCKDCDEKPSVAMQDYRKELETKIDFHLTKAAALIEWRDLLQSDPSFDWSNVTDEQKFIVDNFPCDKVPARGPLADGVLAA